MSARRASSSAIWNSLEQMFAKYSRENLGVRHRWVGALLAASSLCAAMLVTTPARTAHASPASTILPISWTGFSHIVTDSTRVLVSGDNSVVVLDLSGTIISTITGENGADGMVELGTTLYVSLFSAGSIDRIDLTTNKETSTLIAGIVQPSDLVYAGSKLWTTTNILGTRKLVSVDPAAISPTLTTYDNVLTTTNGLANCTRFATNHASNPSFILAFSCAPPYTIDYLDVSGSTPAVTASVGIPSGDRAEDVALNPDGTHFIAAEPVTGFIEYKLSDLTTDGVSYPSDHFPVAVDSNSATGAKLGAGIARQLGTTDAMAYPIGDPTQPLVSVTFGVPSTSSRGVALSQDGMTEYVAASVPSSFEVLEMIPLPALPANGSPASPTGVTAVAGVGASTVTWSPPTYHGTSAITGYTVRSSLGTSISVGASTFFTILAGLSPVPHTFTVTASNTSGPGLPSAPSNAVTPIGGGTFNPLTPARILDTRTGNGGFPIRKVAANTAISLQVTGRGGVPGTAGVGAVVINVAVANPTAAGYLVAYPTGAGKPLASNINFTRGATVPNLIAVGVGTGGKVTLFVGGASADVIADVEGWVGDSTDSYFQSGLYDPLWPYRVWDTRSVSTANGNLHEPLGPGQTLTLQIAGAGSPGLVPPPGAAAVVLNITVTNPTQASYLTVFPSGTPRPLASNLNFTAGQTVPNRVIVGLSSDGKVSIYNGYGTVDVVVDGMGWFTNGVEVAGGSPFIAGVPSRLFDSRTCACKLGPGYVIDFQLQGPNPPIAMSLNVAATNPTAYGFLTVYPDDGQLGMGPVPLTSDLNFKPGQTVANMAVVALYTIQAFNIYNGWGWTDVVVDVDGIYGAATNPLSTGSPPLFSSTTREPQAAPRMPSVRTSSQSASG